jgi:hypothetical protein
MHRLLDLEPRADLIDMYIGEEVDGVFEKVRKEHALRAAGGPAPAVWPAASDPASPRRESVPSVRRSAPPEAAASPALAPSAPPRPASAPAKPYSEAWTRLPEPAAAPVTSALPVASPAAAPRRAPAVRAKAEARSAGRPHGKAAGRPGPYTPWDQIGTAAAADPAPAAYAAFAPAPGEAFSSRRSASRTDPARSARPARTAADAVPDPSSRAGADSARPAWKEAGLWIGGGAALAAIAFTLWQAGSGDGSEPKTYAVPSSLDK